MAGEFYFSGITGAYDWGAIVEQLIAVKSIPIQKLDQERQLISQKLELLGDLSQKISSLKSLLENFNLEEALSYKSARVENPDVLNVSVSEEAPPISFEVSVLQTPQVEILVYDSGFNSLEETVGSSGSFVLRYYTDETNFQEYTVEYSSTDTLQDIVNRINETQDFVRASIYFDGTKYKLMLTETSVANSTVETAPDLSVKAIHLLGTLPSQFGSNVLLQAARNSQIQIGNGTVLESASDTFENVIQGVDITVKQTGTTRVSIEEDYSRISSFLGSFVDQYNELVQTVKSLTLGENAPFKGDNTIMDVKYSLADALTPLLELGVIDYREDGTLSLSGDLEELLANSPEEFTTKMSAFLERTGTLLEIQEDTFKEFEEVLRDRTERITEQIQVLTERLRREELLLRKQFAQLEDFINYANDIRARLQQFMVSLSDMTGGR